MKVYYFFRKPSPSFNSIEELFSSISIQLKNNINISNVLLPFEKINLVSLIKNSLYARNNSSKINHVTGHVNYIVPFLKGKTILTIHDVSSILRGNLIKKMIFFLFWFLLPVLFVKKITVISKFSKKELLKIIPFAKHKVSVIYNPYKPVFTFTYKKFNKKNPLILLIGTKSNKNLERTISALQLLSCQFLIIGKLTKKQKLFLDSYKVKYDNEYNISFDKVIDAYKKCDLLCFASTYEGFGMPIIEAQATGRPVITSNFGAMEEVANDSAHLVDPFSEDSILKGVKKIIKDDFYRNGLIEKGLVNIKRFNIVEISNQYQSLYNEVVKE